ncbi:MAG: hypothetical protein MZV63_18100 [Marinilabiliales bacterium]|nr:hypothetical protein [Marinilabiliales bacterium]
MLEDTGLGRDARLVPEGVLRADGHPVEFVHSGMEERPAPEVETCLFRVVQEATTNIARHADATSCRVYLQRLPASAVLTVEDNGGGFDPGAAGRGAPEGASVCSASKSGSRTPGGRSGSKARRAAARASPSNCRPAHRRPGPPTPSRRRTPSARQIQEADRDPDPAGRRPHAGAPGSPAHPRRTAGLAGGGRDAGTASRRVSGWRRTCSRTSSILDIGMPQLNGAGSRPADHEAGAGGPRADALDARRRGAHHEGGRSGGERSTA